jgi:hypothetical protein
MKLAKQRLAFFLFCSLVFVTAPSVFAYQANQSTAQLTPARTAQETAQEEQQRGAPIASTQFPSLLDSGFSSMYNLDFHSAQQRFTEYQERNPGDPIGPVAEAAGLLFSEFDRLGVLDAQMLVKDANFQARGKLVPDPAVREKFDATLRRGQVLAQKRLAANGNDHDVLFALTLAAGLEADYLALVEKRTSASLSYARQANDYAKRVLTVCHDCYDAYVATGISEYLIGTRAAPVRWILRARGFVGDKREGINELQLAAQHGHYLAPFARILLAIAYLRDKEPQEAKAVLTGLRTEFPGNTLFERELEALGGTVAPPVQDQHHREGE